MCHGWGGYRVGGGMGGGVRSCVPCLRKGNLIFTRNVVYVVDCVVYIIEFDYVR